MQKTRIIPFAAARKQSRANMFVLNELKLQVCEIYAVQWHSEEKLYKSLCEFYFPAASPKPYSRIDFRLCRPFFGLDSKKTSAYVHKTIICELRHGRKGAFKRLFSVFTRNGIELHNFAASLRLFFHRKIIFKHNQTIVKMKLARKTSAAEQHVPCREA